MRSWLRPQSGMRFYIDFDEKGAAFRRPKGVMHRRGTVRASLKRHPIDAAVTFVTLPASTKRARLNLK